MTSASSELQATDSPLPPGATPAAGADARKESYGQILKSSVLIGGSSVIGIGIGMVRTKAMALMLGTAGFGLMGLFTSIQNFALSIAAMGISSSGVRQIAEAVGSGDTTRVARTVAVLRRTAIFLGISGAILLALFSGPVAAFTFEDNRQTTAVALLSLAVLFKIVSDAQAALIQGMRRIADLAWMSVLGAAAGSVASIVLVSLFREKGLVPALISLALMSLVLSWWYSRKVQIKTPKVSLSEVRQETRALLKLGFVFMATGMMLMGSAYVVRVILRREIGLEAAGLYNSAWTIGGLYIGLVLQAMGADFYPRLTAIAREHVAANRLVNEQAQISLLLAGPGVIGTLTFAPLVIAVFYSGAFSEAVGILRWICLGATLQVMTWPMGFIIVAKGLQKVFFWCDFAYVAVHLVLAWFGIKYWGLTGAGIAFFGSFVFHACLVYPVVRRISGFRWSAENKRLSCWLLPLIGAVFCGFHALPFWAATAFGTLAMLFSGIYSVRRVCSLVPLERLPGPLRRLALWLSSRHVPGIKPRA
jgi:PST family polysaccharide transporter